MSKSIGLVDETASPVPPHGEIGGPDDPTGYPSDSNYKYAATGGGYQPYTSVRLGSELDASSHVPAAAWSGKIILSNNNSENTSEWYIFPFFFNSGGGGAGADIKGYGVTPSSTDVSTFAVVRVSSSGTTLSYCAIDTPGGMSDTYKVAIKSVTNNGGGADIVIKVDTDPPAGYYICVIPQVVESSRVSWSDYSAQATCDACNFNASNEQTVNVPHRPSGNTGWCAFLVVGNPANSHPITKSNTGMHS